jgi:hypothetical protein
MEILNTEKLCDRDVKEECRVNRANWSVALGTFDDQVDMNSTQ